MPEQDAIVESSSTEQAVNNEPQSAQEEVTQEQQVTETQEQGNVQQTVDVSDLSAIGDDGVPEINRAREWQRKYEQTVERMPDYIDQAVKEAATVFAQQNKQQQQEPQMSAEQLRAVLLDDSGQYTTGNKIWAQEQLDKVSEQRIAKMLDERVELSQKAQKDARLKAESEAYVVSSFPAMFKRDVNGKVTGFDQSHPMTQLTAKYMKQLGNRPDALREAARQAFVDYQLSNRGSSQKQVALAKSETAQVKKQQIGIGSGNADVNVLQREVADAHNRLKSSGSVKDAVAYNKLKGRLAAIQNKGK